ncbi:Putative auto-transporter adhesin, head GIN domain [Pseudarcicella hirudinis]|uniref:Putative auto-transporter adhesin, head GIN domain n=1 Tax=Pseudarcicella hirudinis TaxID=1079859 RepID=A0A1I5QS86_9BACT|nr:head GIN domain-containing protein [Pseudarcicella hirudinis]SFP49144.1 Putative auto-transporter adhesin, head GIN domain [Pseudarcicella hirudinis]
MNKLKHLFTFALFGLAQLAVAQQNKQEIQFKDFSKLNIQGIMQVEIKSGSVNKVSIEALNGANLDDVTISQSGEELSLKTKIFKQLTDRDNNRRKYSEEKKLYKVEITYQNSPTTIDVGRGAEVNFAEAIKGNSLKVSASSGAILKLEVNANNLHLSSIQGGIVNLYGRANYQEIKVNTGGELNAKELVSEEADVKANTGGVAHVNVTKAIDASAGTGGEITYSGNPSRKNIHSNLGGEVRSY